MRLASEASSYRVLRLLGEGLTGVVYLAERSDSRGLTSQLVALKILKSENRIQWLRREFDVLRAVDSPHCVRLLGWENIPDHGPALVMEAIEGATLEQIARDARFSEAEADEACRQIQAGLVALREAGAFHGDLSPRNALVDEMGRVRLIDFGAPPPDEGAAATPSYAAPEIWRGEAASWRSDLFSLGLLRRDLRDGFAVADGLDENSARRRAQRVSEPGDSWLEPSPHLRAERLDLTASASAQAALGARARRCLEARRSEGASVTRAFGSAATSAAETRLEKRRSQAGSAAAALAFAALASLAAPSRVASHDSPAPARAERAASLEVRTRVWREIWLNGERVGYAPLRIERLRPGPHRLSWRGLKRAGEVRFNAREGQLVRFNERDFKTAETAAPNSP